MTADAGNAQLKTHAYTTSRSDVFELVPPHALRILDVGCSNGALGHALKTALAGREVVGIEMDLTFATEAGGRLDRVINANLDTFDWECGLSNEFFDCIVFADVLEHLVDPYAHLKAALTHLNSDGCVVISLPNIRHLSALISIYAQGRFPRRSRGLFDATHLHWFTIKDGKELLEEIGLIVEAENYSLRFGDRGGGRINTLLNRLPPQTKKGFLLREFFTYQYCLRARRAL